MPVLVFPQSEGLSHTFVVPLQSYVCEEQYGVLRASTHDRPKTWTGQHVHDERSLHRVQGVSVDPEATRHSSLIAWATRPLSDFATARLSESKITASKLIIVSRDSLQCQEKFWEHV